MLPSSTPGPRPGGVYVPDIPLPAGGVARPPATLPSPVEPMAPPQPIPYTRPPPEIYTQHQPTPSPSMSVARTDTESAGALSGGWSGPRAKRARLKPERDHVRIPQRNQVGAPRHSWTALSRQIPGFVGSPKEPARVQISVPPTVLEFFPGALSELGFATSAVHHGRHELRNAMIHVLTIIGLQLPFLLAGGIIIENVFSLPGVGRLVFQAITQRDLIVVQNVIFVLVFAVVTVTLLIDIGYSMVDPRLRRTSR